MFIYTFEDIVGMVFLGLVLIFVLMCVAEHYIIKVKAWWNKQ